MQRCIQRTMQNSLNKSRKLTVSNLGLIYSNILDFVRIRETGEYQPLYSFPENKQIIESVLDYLKTDSPKNTDLKVYDMKFLFYMLKKATCEMGEIVESFNQHITDAFPIRYSFEFEDGPACVYHEDIDKTKYCTQSCNSMGIHFFRLCV
ncbi:protein maelstrom-like isoform X2 [Ceratitis capitata]|uniref:protein maelstrom-like isoform X2 n=1 Tax=Ceratitis capitata TaxID=7213 RepID=UPI000A0F6666|nr:protein maelstrom-like isoform X2 [Ceratitis capitata]